MTDPDQPPAAPVPGKRALTARAVTVGILASAAVAAVTPINDWYLQNTYVYSQYLPIGVFLLVVVLGAVINPLLGRRRFATGELSVIVGMLLVLGGVVSSGLNRVLPPVIAGPARLLKIDPALAHFAKPDVQPPFPHGMFLGMPEQGQPNENDPEYRYLIDGFHTGLPRSAIVRHRSTITWTDRSGAHTALALDGVVGDPATTIDLRSPLGRALDGQKLGAMVRFGDDDVTVIAIEPAGVPWSAWLRAALAWVPLIGGAMVCAVAMAALVRRQWIHNERLPFPIATTIAAFLEEPEPGRRLAPIFRSRVFWAGFALAVLVLLSKGLHIWGYIPLEIQTRFDLTKAFSGEFWYRAYTHWALFTWQIYFSIIGITFFLTAELGFSLWFFFVLTNVMFMIGRHYFGLPLEYHHPSIASMGGFGVQCLLILWVGRTYYMSLLKAALVGGKDPETAIGAIYARILLLAAVGLVAVQVALGAQAHHAVLATLVYLGLMLVLARLVAEAGIPFLTFPWSVNSLILSLTGVGAPAAALVPITLLGMTLVADSRENVLPFAVNAEFLAEKAGVRRLPWSALMLLVLAMGTVIAGVVLIALDYGSVSIANGAAGHVNRDWWWPSCLRDAVGPMANAASIGVNPEIESENHAAMLFGALFTAALGVARLFLSWWPLHPLGYLISSSWATHMIWFSFFLGWLAKALVMRYGGFTIYARLKPFALGLIAGEAVIAGAFLLAGLILPLFDITMPANPKFLPN
ncbi:MAG: hypothetical protein H0W72_07560 [Planctomycetes bacterium]|nr:hypothetical protein [Planctomycetota bacterium]